MTDSALRRSIRGSGAYAVAMLVQRGIGFVLLPLYTRVFAPDEYGQLAVILTISAGVSTLLSFGLETAVFRTYILLREDPEERHRFINSVGLLALAGPISLAVLSQGIFGTALASIFDVSWAAIGLGVVTGAVQVSVILLPFAILRAEERLGSYLRLTAIQAVLITLLTLLFVVVLRWGISGWLLASFIGITATLVAGIFMIHHRWTWTMDRGHVIAALAYGLPLLPHAAAHWGLSVSDRLILGAYATPREVGLYHLAYNFALPISTLAIAMTRGTAPVYAHAVHTQSDRAQLAGVITQHAMVTALSGMAVAVLGPPLIELVLPPEYAGASALLPWLCLGSVLLGLYFAPMNVIAILAGNTRYVGIATLVAATVNIALNLLLVPRFGVTAAAINFAIGYSVLLLGVLMFMPAARAQIDLEWARIGLGFAIIAGVAVCGILLARQFQPATAFAMGIGVVLTAPVLLVLTGVWRWRTRNEPN